MLFSINVTLILVRNYHSALHDLFVRDGVVWRSPFMCRLIKRYETRAKRTTVRFIVGCKCQHCPHHSAVLSRLQTHALCPPSFLPCGNSVFGRWQHLDGTILSSRAPISLGQHVTVYLAAITMRKAISHLIRR